MPTTVLLIGMLSIILLLWVDRISERLRNDSGIVDAIMDVQIHVATAHLWLEQVIGGDTEADAGKVIANLDQATNLIDVTLSGGKAEHKWISEPLKDPGPRARAEAIKSLLVKLKMIGLARLQNPEKSGIGSTSDRQFDAVFKEILGKARELEDVIEVNGAGIEAKSRRLFLGILVVWGFIVVAAAAGLWSLERQRKIADAELLKAHEQLLSQAEELRGHREHLAELVEKRTAELTAANELVRIEMAGRLLTCETLRETEWQIRHLSSKLITAQEIERKRISMELHDALGQALNVMKFQTRVISKGLSEDQRAIREECEELMGYMDQLIEDVRRLSLALSPTVLEDLGLTSALRWLIINFTQNPTVKETSDIEEIDHLLPASHWITIYRVFQEALTNIGKHAGADNVSVVVRSRDDNIIFSIEDDGKGFDTKQALMKDASERGLGLTTMAERMRMIGGVFDLWSQEGKGTRVTFSVPVGKEEA